VRLPLIRRNVEQAGGARKIESVPVIANERAVDGRSGPSATDSNEQDQAVRGLANAPELWRNHHTAAATAPEEGTGRITVVTEGRAFVKAVALSSNIGAPAPDYEVADSLNSAAFTPYCFILACSVL
jgi:hypothetical protein